MGTRDSNVSPFEKSVRAKQVPQVFQINQVVKCVGLSAHCFGINLCYFKPFLACFARLFKHIYICVISTTSLMKSDDYNTLWIVQCQTNKQTKKKGKKEKKEEKEEEKKLLVRCQKSELDVHKSKSMVPSEVSVLFLLFFKDAKILCQCSAFIRG